MTVSPALDIRKFQFTLPRGERLMVRGDVHLSQYVSIHAPARGATGYFRGYRHRSRCFNSRSREGSDNQLLRLDSVA